MRETIRQSDLRNDNAKILRRVAAGESFTVTVHGEPVADLVPHQRPARDRRRFRSAAEFDAAIAQLPVLDAASWRRDMTEADELFNDTALGELPTPA